MYPVPVNRPRILIVDDEADIRSSLKMILEYEEMDSIEAADGPQALARAAQDAPDAVLLDIKMQGMDGLEVLAKLRAIHPEIPIVMVSGHGRIATAGRSSTSEAVPPWAAAGALPAPSSPRR